MPQSIMTTTLESSLASPIASIEPQSEVIRPETIVSLLEHLLTSLQLTCYSIALESIQAEEQIANRQRQEAQDAQWQNESIQQGFERLSQLDSFLARSEVWESEYDDALVTATGDMRRRITAEKQELKDDVSAAKDEIYHLRNLLGLPHAHDDGEALALWSPAHTSFERGSDAVDVPRSQIQSPLAGDHVPKGKHLEPNNSTELPEVFKVPNRRRPRRPRTFFFF